MGNVYSAMYTLQNDKQYSYKLYKAPKQPLMISSNMEKPHVNSKKPIKKMLKLRKKREFNNF